MKKYKHFYNIDPTNFYTLPEEEQQEERIDAFNQFLTSIPSGISIRLTREPLKVQPIRIVVKWKLPCLQFKYQAWNH